MDQYLGEIRMFAGEYAPQDWAFCNGQLLSIVENEALFSLLGTTYGGDGQSNFALPDLRGRVPVHRGMATTGTQYPLGAKGGSEQVTLTVNQLPAHTHVVMGAATAATHLSPEGNVWAERSSQFSTSLNDPTANMSATTSEPNGGNQAHENMMPYLAIHYIISLRGIYPMRG